MVQHRTYRFAAIGIVFLCSLSVLAQPAGNRPAAAGKVAAALGKLDTLKVFEGADDWMGAIRDLSEAGKEATPAVAAKLTSSKRGATLSATAIAARIIGDRRAVPALIYALRRTQPLASDCGVIVPDPELSWLLWEYQTNSRAAPRQIDRLETLSFGRSVREISATLESLTGHTEGSAQLSFYDDDGLYPKVDATATYERTRLLAGAVADRWQAWWDANKAKLLSPEELAWVNANAPVEALGTPPAGPRSLMVELRDGSRDRGLAGEKLDIWIDLDRYQLTTDAAGMAQIPLPAKIQWVSITARHEGLMPAMACFGPDEVLPQQFQMTLSRATSIGGVVRDEARLPIGNASVFVTIGQRLGDHVWASLLDQQTTTDAQGRWSRDDAPADLTACLVRVVHPDFQSEPWYDGGGKRTAASAVDLQEQRLLLIRPALAKIEGTAVDSATGRPLAGATVSAIDDKSWLRSYPDVQTDAAGRFSLAGIYPEKLNVLLTKPGYMPVSQALEPPHPAQIALRASPTHDPLQVHVVDASGEPVAHAIVAVGPWQGHRLLSWHTLTDDQGNFQWPDAPDNGVQLRAHRSGFEMATVQVPPNDRSVTITLTSALLIQGTVTDAATGQPIDKFIIYPGFPWGPNNEPLYQRERGMPGSGGRYSVNFTNRESAAIGNSGKPHFVRIDAEGHLPFFSRGFSESEGHQTLNVQLESAPDITGIVTGPDGKPLKDATVLISTPSQWASVSNGRNDLNVAGENLAATSDDQGRFALRPQREDYTLIALHDSGYAEMSANDFKQNRTIQLQQWGRVEVAVTRGDKPAAGADVVLSQVRFGPMATGMIENNQGGATDSKGSLILDRVQPGHYEAMTMSEAEVGIPGINRGVPVDVAPGQTVKIILTQPAPPPER